MQSGDGESDSVMMESTRRSANVAAGGDMDWGQQRGGDDELVERAQRVDSGGTTQRAQWSREGSAGAVGGGEEGDMHALSWMAPDFDLDELL